MQRSDDTVADIQPTHSKEANRRPMMATPTDQSGMPTEHINKLRVWYPSMRPVKGHGMGSGNSRVIVVDLVGVKSHTNAAKVRYRILMDLSRFPESPPLAYVMSPESEAIQHVNVGYGERTNLAPNRRICKICLGNIDGVFFSWPGDHLSRMRGFLNHLENILNTPNTASRMRG